MTEDEAKTKWCPFARVVAGKLNDGPTATVHQPQTAFNRIDIVPGAPTKPDGAACIGSACMAWRWTERPYTAKAGTEKTLNPGEIAPDKLRERGWVEIARHKNGEGPWASECRDLIEWRVPGKGGCGLAGVPQ